MSDQQLLHPDVREWFEGLMKGGLSPTQALGIYEEALFGGTLAGESELLTQQVLCLSSLSIRSIGRYYLSQCSDCYSYRAVRRALGPCPINLRPSRRRFGLLLIAPLGNSFRGGTQPFLSCALWSSWPASQRSCRLTTLSLCTVPLPSSPLSQVL